MPAGRLPSKRPARCKQACTGPQSALSEVVRSSTEICLGAGYCSPRKSRRGRRAIGDLRDLRWAGVRICFQLPGVLTTPANCAPPSEVSATAHAVTSTRSQSPRKQ